MLIPAVAMMLLSVSSCDSGLRKGTIDDVLAVIPGDASAETMSWRQAGDFFALGDVGGDVGDLFGRVCRLKASDPVVYIHTSAGADVLMAAISDMAVAEDATGDWERVDLGRDGIGGRVCVAVGGTIIAADRFAWLVPSVTDVRAAVAAVSSIPDAGTRLPLPVRETLKPRSGIAVARKVEGRYITATVADSNNNVVIHGVLRDSAGTAYDFGEYALPLDGQPCEGGACAAVAVGLRRSALAHALSEYVQPRLGVKQRLAAAAVSDILRDVCGTLRAAIVTEGDAAALRLSMPYAEGGAAAAVRRLSSMIQRFGLQSELSVKALGDTLMQMNMPLDERPSMFDGVARMPQIAPDKGGTVLMAVGIAPVRDDAVHFDGVQAVVCRRDFTITLRGIDLRRLSAVLHR